MSGGRYRAAGRCLPDAHDSFVESDLLRTSSKESDLLRRVKGNLQHRLIQPCGFDLFCLRELQEINLLGCLPLQQAQVFTHLQKPLSANSLKLLEL
jgi:hypothetical protein